jgi:Flp pilus assembly CpaE family ATPase
LSAIVVCAGKGSPGASFVAANLAAALSRSAAALSRSHEDPLLLDLDPAGGDLGCYLGLDPRRGLYPLLRMEGGVGGVTRLLAEAEEHSGVRVIAGFPEASGLASAEVLATALEAARSSDGTVIGDIGRVGETNAPVAASADLVLVVVRADLVSVLGAERAIRRLEGAGTPRDRIRLVVSGHDRRRPGDLAEVSDALHLPVLAAVPLDRRGARRAIVSQTPAASRRLRKAFDALSAATRRTLTEAAREREAVAPVLTEARA